MRIVRSSLVVLVSTNSVLFGAACSGPRSRPTTSQHVSAVERRGGTTGALGYRQLSIGTSLSKGGWLTVELHPTTAPVHLSIKPVQVSQICPATLAGQIGTSSSWPARFHFSGCIPLDRAGQVSLPPTDGRTHVAFALRATTSQKLSVDLVVSYTAEDSFVGVVAPGRPGTETVTVSYFPSTSTTGVLVTSTDGSSTPGADPVTVSQAGRGITTPDSCDFPSEFDCMGPVTPRVAISVRLTPQVSPVLLLLSWD